MKFIRFIGDSTPQWGVVEGGHVCSPLGDYPLQEVQLLAPCEPTKIICAGLNYIEHAAELDMQMPTEPLIFLKPPSSLAAHEDDVPYPASSSRLEFEGELVAVISRTARNVAAEEAHHFIAGYTVGNDITARDFQVPGSQWTRAKGYDMSTPIGPALVRASDADMQIRTLVNGIVRQDGNTSDMVFGTTTLISYISSIMTLNPGDVVMTGTPPGIGELQIGDQVEVEIDGIGILRNRIVADRTSKEGS